MLISYETSSETDSFGIDFVFLFREVTEAFDEEKEFEDVDGA